MMRFAATLSLALVLSDVRGSAAGGVEGQEQPPPRSTFRSAVDLVPVDVNVVDKDGRPVKDLAAGDFTLAVDGKPRRIASAQFISVDQASDSEPAKAREFTSNAGAQAGRLVMIAIDSGNIGSGRGKQAVDAAKRFVGTLNRNDRVALVVLPGAGPQIEFTSNHAIVQTLLGNVVGQAADNIGQVKIGLAEALAIDRNDRLAINEVTDRECPSNSAPEIVQSCLVQLAAESRQMIAQVKRRTNNTLISLRYLFAADGGERRAENARLHFRRAVARASVQRGDVGGVARRRGTHHPLRDATRHGGDGGGPGPHVTVARRGSARAARGPGPARWTGQGRGLQGHGQCRLRVSAPRRGDVGLLPAEFRARAGRSRRQAAQDQHRYSAQGSHAALAA